MNHTNFPSANSKMAGTAIEEEGAFNAMDGISFNANSNFPQAGIVNNSTANSSMQRKPKRRSSGDQRVVTGRSFKRLRLGLDHVHVPDPSGSGNLNYAESQSTGTLSVGTMGGDLESNDEDLGEDDDETEEGDGSTGLGRGGESVASSWVASLGSSNFRKRRAGGLPQTMNDNVQFQSHAAPQFQALEGDEYDDAATCSAMTTAAVAPRRRHARSLKREGQKRRAIQFVIDTPAARSGNENATEGKQNKSDDDLEIEDLEVDSILTNGRYVPSNLESVEQLKKAPPIEQIPDPLLVAAQHAAGGPSPYGPNVAFDSSMPLAASASSAISQSKGNGMGGTVLVMGDCCSSVTEEETSLAEDEASISAISIGANTTVSALSGGMEGSVHPCASTGSGTAGSFDQVDRQKATPTQQDASMASTPMKSNNSSPGAMMKSTDSSAMQTSPYVPLNSILGGLHKERLNRLSTNRPLSRGESSLHSMGSVHSGGGASYRSLPNNFHTANAGVNAMSWSMHGQQQPPPPPFLQQQPKPLSMMDEDAEMEEADDTPINHHQDIGALGSFHGHSGQSVASLRGSHAGSFGNLSRASSTANGVAVAGDSLNNSANAGQAVPKWKRTVNLPSHSTLY